jgi:DNA-binding PadR family transcriptional regulator
MSSRQKKSRLSGKLTSVKVTVGSLFYGNAMQGSRIVKLYLISPAGKDRFTDLKAAAQDTRFNIDPPHHPHQGEKHVLLPV